MPRKRIVPEPEVNKNRNLIIILVVIFVLAFLAMMLAIGISITVPGSSSSGFKSFSKGTAAHISITGVLTTAESRGLFSDSIDSAEVVELIEEAGEDPSIKAVIFEINSPGGSPVASDEIATAIKRLDKPTVSYIRDVGASGGYWVASSTDHVLANRMSITGSIGVIGSYLEFEGLLNRYNITYRRIISGKYKDIGSPFRTLSEAEEQMLQQQVDILRQEFITTIAENRNLSRENVSEIATGMFFLGAQAKDMGLIDDFGGKEEAKEYLEHELNMTITIKDFEKKESFFDAISSVFADQSFSVGKGIGSSLLDEKNQVKSVRIWT